MTLIGGIFKDSGGVVISSGILRVKLDAPLTDTATTPQSYNFQIARDFPITNGRLPLTGSVQAIDLPQSEVANISYTFLVLQSFTDYYHYKSGSGDYYTTNDQNPTHIWTDGKYYSGVTHATDSILLERVSKTRSETVGEAFQAIVPNVGAVDFASLKRTGFATDRGPQTARQVGEYLKADPLFLQSLINILVTQGAWDAAILYRRGNLVLVGGSTYQCIADTSINNPPAASPATWKLFAGKGDPGGTGGNNTAFGAGWNGDLNAPSKNVIYQEFVSNRATKAEVDAKAPLASPALTGIPTAPTQSAGTGTGTNKTAIATCEYTDRANGLLSLFEVGIVAIAFTANPPAKTLALQSTSRLVSRVTYSALFARLGTTYSAGDGTTTFGLPPTTMLPTIPSGSGYYVISSGV